MERALGRSPTFLVGTEKQQYNLEQLQKREQHLAENYQKNKPLTFNAGAYQKTHPMKAVGGHKDADATLISPMLLGVADGVSQIEDFGLDASELPNDLLKACEELAMPQLIPDFLDSSYRGPIPLMREAYESTDCYGSTTICLAILDNSTKIHGKLHPMIAVLSIGDCELLVLRRLQCQELYETVFHTEMQRIDGNAQCPLQVCRLDDRIDPNFDERIAIEVIERGSAVHCVSIYEGDIVVMGSDGVFDNLFIDEIIAMVNEMLPPARAGAKFRPTDAALLKQVATRIVDECHAKTKPSFGGGYPDTPIGIGGKRDDTCCVVGEVIEFTDSHREVWSRIRRQQRWNSLFTCGTTCANAWRSCCDEGTDKGTAREYPHGPGSLYSEGADSDDGSPDENESERRCSIQ
jgi:protein phosphatase PTC7